MSRRVDRSVDVRLDVSGVPVEVDGLLVGRVCEHWREWIGIHDGEPERDIWLVEIGGAVGELHCLRWPVDDNDDPPGRWLLHAWRD